MALYSNPQSALIKMLYERRPDQRCLDWRSAHRQGGSERPASAMNATPVIKWGDGWNGDDGPNTQRVTTCARDLIPPRRFAITASISTSSSG